MIQDGKAPNDEEGGGEVQRETLKTMEGSEDTLSCVHDKDTT